MKYLTEDQFRTCENNLEVLADDIDIDKDMLARCLLHINELKSFFENSQADLFLNEYVLNERRKQKRKTE